MIGPSSYESLGLRCPHCGRDPQPGEPLLAGAEPENVAEPGCAYVVTPQMKRLADEHARLEADLATLRDAAWMVVDAEYRREQWGSDTVATFDRALAALREELGRA